MDAPTTISAIAAIISAFALWVAYRAFMHSKQTRFDEKLMELRIQTVALRNRILLSKNRLATLSQLRPNLFRGRKPITLDRTSELAEKLHQMLFRKTKGWDELYINDKLIDLKALEGEMAQTEESIERAQKALTISSSRRRETPQALRGSVRARRGSRKRWA